MEGSMNPGSVHPSREAEANDRLRKLLLEMWALFSDVALQGETPDQIRRSQAFIRVDRQLRKEGILPPVKAPK